MSYSNYPSASPGNPAPPPPKDNRKLVYGILIAALVGTWGYIIYDKNKSGEQIKTLTTQYTAADSSRTAVEAEYNDALARMDSLTGSNTKLTGDLAARQQQIDSLKTSIRAELGKKNADL